MADDRTLERMIEAIPAVMAGRVNMGVTRAWLIQQAVINACEDEWSWAHADWRVIKPFLEGYTNAGRSVNGHLRGMILFHFRALVESYGGTVCR